MLRPLCYRDYFPLTGSRHYQREHIWLAYQLNRPDQKDGI